MDSEELKNLCINRLIYMLNEKDESDYSMSLALGKDKSYINKVTNGNLFPTLLSWNDICEYLEIDLCDFLNFNDHSPNDELFTAK